VSAVRFSDAQIELYSRQIILRELGGNAQEKLLAARCLALGGGPALDTALSYLAGAGLGAIDRLSRERPGSRPGLPFAALPARNPDVRLRDLTTAATLSLDDYELVVLVIAREDGLPAALPAGQPQVGSLAVLTAADGTLDLALLPRGAACLACLDCSPSGARAGGPDAALDSARLGLAGALLALAACRWIAGIERDPQPRAFRLGARSALWVEGAVRRRASCPRGCPPAAQPV